MERALAILVAAAGCTGPSIPPGSPGCTNTCRFAGDGQCDDGGDGAEFDLCTLGTDCDDCGPRTVDPGPSGGESRCRGVAWGCREMSLPYPTDVGACASQPGCGWDFVWEQCGDNPFPCGDHDDARSCTRTVGCEWTNDDGTIEGSLLRGECTGTPTPCPTYTDQASCNQEPACRWGFSAGCETDFSQVSIGYTCATWSVDDIADDGHPAVNMDRCERRDGCTWTGDRYAQP
jgi:hypothetical protein